MAEEDTVDVESSLIVEDAPTSETENFTVIEGGFLDRHASAPDMEKEVHIMDATDERIRAAILEERRFYSELGKNVVRANTNISGSARFATYTVYANQPPIMIAKEKPLRGDMLVTVYTAAAIVSIGFHAGITVSGMDTVAIVGAAAGASRTIRYRGALWVVSSADAQIDIQEEFD